MITVFNRKELIITYSMDEQNRVREILAQNKIDYVIKTANRNSTAGRSGRTAINGSFGDTNSMYEYKVYVHKNDYERAKGVIRR